MATARPPIFMRIGDGAEHQVGQIEPERGVAEVGSEHLEREQAAAPHDRQIQDTRRNR